jgi:hypothetical protein
MTTWLAEFRFVRPSAKIAIIAKILLQPNFGNNGNFGSGIPIPSDSACAANALHCAENALLPVDDEAELMIRGKRL